MAEPSPPTARQATSPGLPWTAWLAAAGFLLFLLPRIGQGTLWHHDELLTANRSREMLVRGDPLAVTVNFVPSVKKPPLQYWLCAGLLWALPGHPEFAVRLPTLLGGVMCILTAALLARTWFPADGSQLAAWSAALLAGCGYLIHFSRVALLDTNAAWLLTLALILYHRAQKDARWWWTVAVVCVLGAWQKAPYGLAAWAILLVADRCPGPKSSAANPPPPTARRRFHLPMALAVAVAGSLGWWAVQWLREDHALLLVSGREQVDNFLRAHDPSDEGFRPWLYWFWLARDWVLPGLCAPVAVLAMVLAGRHDRAGVALGWVALLFGGVAACLAYRAERYLVVITPLLAVLTVHGVHVWSRRFPAAFRDWALPIVLASTLPVAAFHYLKPAPDHPDLLAAARALARTERPGERLLVCTDADPDFETADFVLFYARLHRPLEAVTLPMVEALPINAGPCRGLCRRKQWAALRERQPGFRPVTTLGDWVLWTH